MNTTAAPALPSLCSPEQASQGLGVPLSRLARWRSKGVGPVYVKIEGRVSYTLDSLVEFINRSTVQTNANGDLD